MLDAMQLLRLNDCAKTTRMGLIDYGFPRTMRELATMQLVELIGRGHCVTTKGFELLNDPEIVQRLRKI